MVMNSMISKSLKVLVFADANTRASIAIIRSLSRSEIPFCVALNFGTKFNFLKLLSITPDNTYVFFYRSDTNNSFIDSLIDIRKKAGPLVIFPTGEKYLRWILEGRRQLEDNEILIPCVGLKTYEDFSNKDSFLRLVKNIELDIPKEYLEIPARYEKHFVVKPKKACWGKQDVLEIPWLVDSERSYNHLLAKNINIKEHLIQEYINGASFYYCALYQSGIKKAFFIQQTIAQEPSGKSVIAAVPSILPDDIVQKVDQLMMLVKWEGVMMMEFKRMNKKYYAIECNPRFWGPLQLSIDNGVDFPSMLYRLSLGLPLDQVAKPNLQYGYRWLNGYIHGFLLWITSGNKFQNYKNDNGGVTYADVLWRKDSYRYAIFDLISSFGVFTILNKIRSKLRR